MDFNSIADAELLFQDMVDRKIHLAHEVSDLAISWVLLVLPDTKLSILNRPLLAQLAFSPTILDFIVPNHFLSPGAVRRSLQRKMHISLRPHSMQSSFPRYFQMHTLS